MSEREKMVARGAIALAAKTVKKKSAPVATPKPAKAAAKKPAPAKTPKAPPAKAAAKSPPKPQPKAAKSLTAAVKTKAETKPAAKPAAKAVAKPAVKAAPAKAAPAKAAPAKAAPAKAAPAGVARKEAPKLAAKPAAKPAEVKEAISAPVKAASVKLEKTLVKADPAQKAAAKPLPKPAPAHASSPQPAAAIAAPVASPAPAPAPASAPAQAPAPVMHSGVVAGPMRPMTPPRAMAKAEIFVAGDFVVYPTHGVGKVERIATEEIAGHTLELIHITFDENRMTLRVPTNKARTAGLRKLASPKQFADVLATLKGRARIKRTMWSRRAQEYEAKINSGDPQAIAEVVRDLHRNAGQPDQSFSERQIYESALDRLAAEYGALEKVDKATAIERLIAHLKSE
jgi:CarD family transcriptional regulator